VVVFVGAMSALLVIPQIRAVAGGILASSAIIGLVVGFAARSTLANFVAGLLIALSQPLRIGDYVQLGGWEGVVEEIGLTYTRIRTERDARVVVPNEKLASDTICNSTLVSREEYAEVTVRVPLAKDLEAVVAVLQEVVAGEAGSDVRVTALDDAAVVTVRALAGDPAAAERLRSDLRLRAHGRLRAAGLLE
jgi:small conductance mechanosensitive channel